MISHEWRPKWLWLWCIVLSFRISPFRRIFVIKSVLSRFISILISWLMCIILTWTSSFIEHILIKLFFTWSLHICILRCPVNFTVFGIRLSQTLRLEKSFFTFHKFLNFTHKFALIHLLILINQWICGFSSNRREVLQAAWTIFS